MKREREYQVGDQVMTRSEKIKNDLMIYASGFTFMAILFLVWYYFGK